MTSLCRLCKFYGAFGRCSHPQSVSSAGGFPTVEFARRLDQPCGPTARLFEQKGGSVQSSSGSLDVDRLLRVVAAYGLTCQLVHWTSATAAVSSANAA